MIGLWNIFDLVTVSNLQSSEHGNFAFINTWCIRICLNKYSITITKNNISILINRKNNHTFRNEELHCRFFAPSPRCGVLIHIFMAFIIIISTQQTNCQPKLDSKRMMQQRMIYDQSNDNMNMSAVYLAVWWYFVVKSMHTDHKSFMQSNSFFNSTLKFSSFCLKFWGDPVSFSSITNIHITLYYYYKRDGALLESVFDIKHLGETK